MMLHYNDGRYQCEICGRKFSQRYQLVNHAKTTCTAELHSILFKQEVKINTKKFRTEIQKVNPIKKSTVRKEELKVTVEEIKNFLDRRKSKSK